MTTTITVKTDAWPVEVKSLEFHEHDRGSYFGKRIEIVPPNSEHTVHISQTMRVNFLELPLPEQPTA